MMAKFKKGDPVRLSYYDTGDTSTKVKNKAHAGEIAVVDEDTSTIPYIIVTSKHPDCPYCNDGRRHCWDENYMVLILSKPSFNPRTDYFYTKVENEEEFERLKVAVDKLGLSRSCHMDNYKSSKFYRVGEGPTGSTTDCFGHNYDEEFYPVKNYPFLPLSQALERLGGEVEKVEPTIPENTVVHVKTEEEYNTLMRAYEAVGWRWGDGDTPTAELFDGAYSHIDLKQCFRRCLHRAGCSVISLTQALEILRKVYPKEMEGIVHLTTISADSFYTPSGYFKVDDAYLTSKTPLSSDGLLGDLDRFTYQRALAIDKISLDLLAQSITSINPTIMETLRTLTKTIKRSLNPDAQALYRAGYTDIDGALTPAGLEAQNDLIRDEYEAKLVLAAKAHIKEVEAEEKKK